jgi:alpha/beta superfamily hydrolase
MAHRKMENRMRKLMIYNHGKDSIPWGEKALAMADVAKRHGYEVLSPDYTVGNDPDVRVKQLLAQDIAGYDKIVLVGSSMGAYVATVAADMLGSTDLFLLAPAFYLPGYQCKTFSPPVHTLVIHGWQDDVVPPDNAWRFCQQYQCQLLMLDADHRLTSHLPRLAEEFERFLGEC